MREEYLEELVIALISGAVASLILTDALNESWHTFAGVWMLMVMIIWGIIAEVKKRMP